MVDSLGDLFPASSHVFDHGTLAADDIAIWDMAGREDFVIATKDTDFLDLSLLRGAPPKVVLLRTGNVPTSHIEMLLRRHAGRLGQFSIDQDEAVLIIDR